MGVFLNCDDGHVVMDLGMKLLLAMGRGTSMGGVDIAWHTNDGEPHADRFFEKKSRDKETPLVAKVYADGV